MSTTADSILVTGASGFIGGAILRHLQQGGLEAADLREVLRGAGLLAEPRYFRVDDLLALGAPPRVIVHCAANSSIGASFEDPAADMRSGLHQVGELLEYARRCDAPVKLVYLSTSAVYGDTVSPSDELARSAPVSPYGLHKVMAEEAIAYYGRAHGVEAAILRPFSVYGAGQRKQLIWDALCRFKRHDNHFHGGADNVRDFIDVRDVASFVPYAMAAANARAPVFNVSTGVGTTVREALKLLADLAGSTSPVTFGDAVWPGDPRVLVGMNARARALGWEPRVSLESGFSDVAAWYARERHDAPAGQS